MQLYRHPKEINSTDKGCVVALVNFDGFHRGHHVVIGEAGRLAREMGLNLAVVTEPHPVSFFQPDKDPFRLTPFRPRAQLLEKFGVDMLLVLPFDKDLASLGAQDFVHQVLLDGLDVKHVCVGYDYRYGAKRSGGVDVLRHMGDEEGFGVSIIDAVASARPNETDLSLIEKLGAENNLIEYEEIGSKVSDYSSVQRLRGKPVLVVDNDEAYSPDQRLRKKTVLVVDDDEAALEEMIETLNDCDLFVVSAKDAEEAICQANRHKPAYVVMDFNLPKMNGLDAVTFIRKLLPDTIYIMISGCQDFCRVATAINTKSFAVLQKPISMDRFGRFIISKLATS
jgi:ActR/RegA family two-component response regulator